MYFFDFIDRQFCPRCSFGILEFINPMSAAGFMMNLHVATCPMILAKVNGFGGE